MQNDRNHVLDAARAHTTLCLFEATALMLESSDITGSSAQEVAAKAVRMLRKEQQTLLRQFERSSRLARKAPSHE